MHAIVFEAAATNAQSDLPGILSRPHILPVLFGLGVNQVAAQRPAFGTK